jgi:hypothetical protein
MKRIVPVFRGGRACKGKTGLFIEEGVAYNDGYPTAFLFMPGLWIKVEPDKITFPRDIDAHHSSLPTGAPKSSSDGL